MMMPANFTAVNSEVVYGGAADLFTILADTTAPIWGTKEVKQFNTNLLTILSNSFVSPLLNVTMGTMFGGNWGKDGVKLFGDEGTASKFFKNQAAYDSNGDFTGFDGDEMTFGNKVMRVLGSAAAVYTLGTTPVKNAISENVLTIAG